MRAQTPILALRVRAATLATLLVLMTATWSVGVGADAGISIDVLDPTAAVQLFVYFGGVVMVVMGPTSVLALTLVRGGRTWWAALVVLALTFGAGLFGLYRADDIFAGLGLLLSITWIYGSGAMGIVAEVDRRSRRRSGGAVDQPV